MYVPFVLRTKIKPINRLSSKQMARLIQLEGIARTGRTVEISQMLELRDLRIRLKNTNLSPKELLDFEDLYRG